jgi:hypothetical protein
MLEISLQINKSVLAGWRAISNYLLCSNVNYGDYFLISSYVAMLFLESNILEFWSVGEPDCLSFKHGTGYRR